MAQGSESCRHGLCELTVSNTGLTSGVTIYSGFCQMMFALLPKALGLATLIRELPATELLTVKLNSPLLSVVTVTARSSGLSCAPELLLVGRRLVAGKLDLPLAVVALCATAAEAPAGSCAAAAAAVT